MPTRREFPCTQILSKGDHNNIAQSQMYSAITLTSSLWKPGDKGTVTVTFGDYSCDGCSPSASWSQVGKNCNNSIPSTNLGFIDPPYGSFTFQGVTYNVPDSAIRNYCGTTGPTSCSASWTPGATVLHEFGHILGMLHEHQNDLQDADPIKLNKSQVEAYYSCIGMGSSGAATNVLNTYTCIPGKTCNYAGTRYDPLSIMLYYLPSAWIQGCKPYTSTTDCNSLLAYNQTCTSNPTKPNFVLSPEDIGWLKQQYPLTTTDPPVITVKFVDSNPPSWKVAWVQKVITETYGPMLGLKWNFDTASILQPSPKKEKFGSYSNVSLSQGELIGAILGGIAGCILLLTIVGFIAARINNSNLTILEYLMIKKKNK